MARIARAQAPLPNFVAPELATLVSAVPLGESWIHEIKFDGYRMQLRVDGQSVSMLSRNGKDWTGKFPRLVEQARALGARRVILDGEVVHLDQSGKSSFSRLVDELGKGAGASVAYQVFDLLYIDGEDWTGQPLLARKERLAQLLDYAQSIAIRYSDHVEGHGEEFFATACKQELEGIISKLASSPYRSGRSRDWLKVKCIARQELVLCGYLPSTKSGDEIGSLILGVHDEHGALRYAGRVGTGFTRAQRRELKRIMDARKLGGSPFAAPVEERGMRQAQWAAPDLVGEVAFMEWTEDGRLRHPSFQGLREDKNARDVVRETPRAPISDTRSKATSKVTSKANDKPGAVKASKANGKPGAARASKANGKPGAAGKPGAVKVASRPPRQRTSSEARRAPGREE
jgi:bifunctional non-homologous end joining protein LigD